MINYVFIRYVLVVSLYKFIKNFCIFKIYHYVCVVILSNNHLKMIIMRKLNGKIVRVLGMFVLIPFLSVDSKPQPKSDELEPIINEVQEPDPIDYLIDAMIIVESGGNDSAIGDTHLGDPSVGVLQIRPIMVREVNRLLKKMGSEERFKLKDRFDRDKSIEMFKVWYSYYHEDSEFETIARSWNGGPKGPTNSRTAHYWNKVQDQLN